MTMSIPPCKRSLTDVIPLEVIASIAAKLDICSLWNLLDTCQYLHNGLLESQSIWRRIVVDLTFWDLSAFYAALRRLRDSNGLRSMVQEVIMDGCDDAMISPIVMLVKFPHLQRLSSRHRRFNTNLEVDTKLLQELLKDGTLLERSLALESLGVYHHYMSTEPHLAVFQNTLNRLARNRRVKLDIAECRGDGESPDLAPCTRIIDKDARCWNCGYNFKKCWQCVSECSGCFEKRLPPLANEQKMRSASATAAAAAAASSSSAVDDDAMLKDQFSVFE